VTAPLMSARSGLMSTIHVVSYPAMGLPAVIGGLLSAVPREAAPERVCAKW
jgi:hypothetical protein